MSCVWDGIIVFSTVVFSDNFTREKDQRVYPHFLHYCLRNLVNEYLAHRDVLRKASVWRVLNCKEYDAGQTQLELPMSIGP